MKLLYLLVAIYILVLSGLPCEVFCQEETKSEQSSSPDSKEHSHDECCSPFCVCATCSNVAFPQTQSLLVPLLIVSVFIETTPTLFQSLYALDVSGGIWQPPRLG